VGGFLGEFNGTDDWDVVVRGEIREEYWSLGVFWDGERFLRVFGFGLVIVVEGEDVLEDFLEDFGCESF